MCYIIAEIGVNHNGKEDLAYQLIDIAKNAGADAVKFQTFKSDLLVIKNTKTAEYQKINSGENNQYNMLKKLELSQSAFKRIKQYCDDINIEFISTPFDCQSVDLLENIGVNIYKIGSGDLTNYQLLKKVASKHKQIILSTGMSNMAEVINAVEFIKKQGNSDLVLLHCISAYPTKLEETNLKAIQTMQIEFKNIPIGFSDHTHGDLASVIAVSLGATHIEKHFTLDCNMSGPDHKASLNPKQLFKFIQQIRETEIMLGHGIKQCMPCELPNKNIARRSIAVNKNMDKNSILHESDIICLRPNTGICSTNYFNIIGTQINTKKLKYEILDKTDIYYEH